MSTKPTSATAPVQPIVHTPGPWRPCGAADKKCQCRMIWSESADCVVGVAIMSQDESYTCGEGIADPEIAARNQWLMAAAPEMLDAIEAFLDCWKRAGPQGSHQFEKFDACVRKCEMAREKALGV